MEQFTELGVLSNFSFLRGASHPEELVGEAAARGYSAVALADLHSLAGIVRAHCAAKKHAIKLIVGSRIRLLEALPEKHAAPDEAASQELTREIEDKALPFFLLLYPTNRAAYGNLCALLTRGKRRAPKGECWLTIEDIADFDTGLLGLILVHRIHDQRLRASLEKLRQILTDDRLSLAISRHYGPLDEQLQHEIITLGKTLSLPLCATNDVHYHKNSRRRLQDVLTCIRQRSTLEKAGFLLLANAERYIKSPEEMNRLFRQTPLALARAQQIADAASRFSLDELTYEYPEEICPDGMSPLDYLKELTAKGAHGRYPHGVPDKVHQQIQHEFELVKDLGYAKYFLTVFNIVSFARSKNILCQGRGAAANSAICYCLGITAVPPDKIDLLVERFISKERNEPPDIDIDFEHERREEVIQYIYQKFGRHRAALVSEVITYRRRSAVREVAKVFGLSSDTIETLQALLRNEDEEQITARLLRSHGLNPHEPAIRHAVALSRTIRGFPRHLSQHVGGFIISQEDLSSIVPIENAAMPGRTVIEWDKDDIERMGMLKIDVLGLGMLTCIRKAFELVNNQPTNTIIENNYSPTTVGAAFTPPIGNNNFLTRQINHSGGVNAAPTNKTMPRWSHEQLLLHNIPPDDPAVYDMICRADTIGVFQIESRAQMSMLPRLRPRSFYDLVIEVAIIRPGPIQGGMVHPYLRRRNGEERVTFPDKHVKRILHRTLGVPIFQEQVMELAVVAAGFTAGEADELRRAMASWKRNKDAITQFGMRLIGGMLERGYALSFAKQVFQQIRGFSEYGFPQSHAASFALLVYVSAWLKHHHPAAFAAALINSQPMGFYKPSQIIQDAKRHGVRVLPIDVNKSNWDCTLEGRTKPALRLGMRLVKGLRKNEANQLSAQILSHGSYSSLLNLWRDSGVRVQTLKALARADAFSSLGLSRQQALWDIKKLRDDSLPLFAAIEEHESAAPLPKVSRETQVMFDYEAIGHSLKAHPLSFLRKTLNTYGVATAQSVKDKRLFPRGVNALLSGVVLVRQRPSTANGVTFLTIEDETGFSNLIIKPDIFRKYRAAIVDSSIIVARGLIQRDGDALQIVVREVFDISGSQEALEKLSRNFH